MKKPILPLTIKKTNFHILEIEFAFSCEWLFRTRIIFQFFSTFFLIFKFSPTNFLDFSSYQFPIDFSLFYRHFLTHTLAQQQLILHYYSHQLTNIDTAHFNLYSVVELKIGYSNIGKLTCVFDLLSDSACLKTANLSETLVSIFSLYLNSSVRFSWCWLDLKKRNKLGLQISFEISSKITPEF